jgi:hypothetical protein
MPCWTNCERIGVTSLRRSKRANMESSAASWIQNAMASNCGSPPKGRPHDAKLVGGAWLRIRHLAPYQLCLRLVNSRRDVSRRKSQRSTSQPSRPNRARWSSDAHAERPDHLPVAGLRGVDYDDGRKPKSWREPRALLGESPHHQHLFVTAAAQRVGRRSDLLVRPASPTITHGHNIRVDRPVEA